jgi:hypothetical protein
VGSFREHLQVGFASIGAVALREESLARVPFIVFGCALVIVRAHRTVVMFGEGAGQFDYMYFG